jgi:tRNA pseudouridine38-40 synthase
MTLAHYKVILSYNGSAYAGFQRQRNVPTVQSVVEGSLRKMGWQGSSMRSAGRTDAGVHARGQVISFQLDWKHSTEDLRNALNYYLPADVAAQSVAMVPNNFHPRFDATSRRYRYKIICQPVRDPLRSQFSWQVWPAVKVEVMNKAAEALIGQHDFCAFGSPTAEGGTTVREVWQAEWQQQGDEAYFEIVANAFLYHMVRRITFALVAVGQASVPVEIIKTGIETGALPLTGLAPAQGLVLEEVRY